jgi:hypothetical protein
VLALNMDKQLNGISNVALDGDGTEVPRRFAGHQLVNRASSEEAAGHYRQL